MAGWAFCAVSFRAAHTADRRYVVAVRFSKGRHAWIVRKSSSRFFHPYWRFADSNSLKKK
jgi:hypothetical protein